MDVDSIIESAVDTAVNRLISGVLDFVLSNIIAVLLSVAILLFIVVLLVFIMKRRLEKAQLQRIKVLFNEKKSELNRMLVSEAFKELESGFIQGHTKDALVGLEQGVLVSHQKAAALRERLEAQKVALFSVIEFAGQVRRLKHEVHAFADQVDYYRNELAELEKLTRETAGLISPVQQRFDAAVEQINTLAAGTALPLTGLNKSRENAEAAVQRARLSSSFDAVRARQDVQAAAQAVDELHARVARMEQDSSIVIRMRARLQEQIDQLQQRLPDHADANRTNALNQLSDQLEQKMLQLEKTVYEGRAVNLRAAALEIEEMLEHMKQNSDG